MQEGGSGVRPGASEVGSNCSTMVWMGGEMGVPKKERVVIGANFNVGEVMWR